jgi:hypothetical protein
MRYVIKMPEGEAMDYIKQVAEANGQTVEEAIELLVLIAKTGLVSG